MNRFIRLSAYIINPRYIQSIVKTNDKQYLVNLITNKNDVSGTLILGSGGFETDNGLSLLIVTGADYEKLEKWIDNNSDCN